MINSQIVYYLGSKIIAAVLNLLTMALFVRLGGAETYGAYLVNLAWAYILYGTTLQWLRFSFFASFREETSPDLIATYLRALLIGLAGLTLFALAVVMSGLAEPEFAAGVVALVIGLASYDALSELSRTQLRARDVAIGVMARAILMLVLGVGALVLYASPLMLAVSVGVAHLCAAMLLLFLSRDVLGGTWSREAIGTMWGFGHPLVPAFGFDAVGLQLDRLLLARYATLDAVGNYGAAADFIRQTMIVFAEAIAGAYISVARTDAVEGRVEAARVVLGQAFLAYTALTVFAAAVILRFDRILFDALFGAEIGAAVEPIVALIVASNAAGIFRAYYFGQVLYLTPSAQVLLYSNAMHVATVAVVGLLLVPAHGAAGAALAMLLGHVAGCAVYIVHWRYLYVLQLPYGSAAVLVAMAAAGYLLTGYIEQALDSVIVSVFVNMAVYGMIIIAAARIYNILSFNELSAFVVSYLRGHRT